MCITINKSTNQGGTISQNNTLQLHTIRFYDTYTVVDLLENFSGLFIIQISKTKNWTKAHGFSEV
jgi:hypothetical protein